MMVHDCSWQDLYFAITVLSCVNLGEWDEVGVCTACRGLNTVKLFQLLQVQQFMLLNSM